MSRCLQFVVALLIAGAARADLPITVTEINQQKGGTVTRGFVAQIDLSDPRVEIVVTQPRPAAEGVEARRVPQRRGASARRRCSRSTPTSTGRSRRTTTRTSSG
jgi:hypothetical protein